MTKFCSLALSLTAILLAFIPLRGAEPVQTLPVGTFLPVMLGSNLDSDKSKPGEKISAKLKQDVDSPDRGVVKVGTEITGHIVSVKRAGGGANAQVVFVFDHLRISGKEYP